jgi:hypothetical protein
MQQEVLPTDKQNITVKLGIPSPQTLERLGIQNATVKRMLLFRPKLLSLNSRYSQGTSWKRLASSPHLHILQFLMDRQPRQTHLHLHFKFEDNSIRWSHNTSTERQSYGKNLRNVFECDHPNTSLIYVTRLQKINRRYHSTAHNATWPDQCTDGHWPTPLQFTRRFRLPSRRWWGPRLTGMLHSSGDSWLPKRRQPTTNLSGVNIPEEHSPQLERSEQISHIPVTSVLIL